MRSIAKNILLFFVLLFILGAVFSLYNQPVVKPKTMSIGELVQNIEEEKVKSIAIDSEKLEITLTNDEKFTAVKEPEDSLTTILKNYNTDPLKVRKVTIGVKTTPGWIMLLQALLPFLIPFLIILGFFWFMSRQVQGMNNRAMSFGQSGAKEAEPKGGKDRVAFKDVAGVKEAKEELQEIVEFLKTPKKFTSLGAKIPKGVLLMGGPGTGKTLLARAVAGEADVPFFHISGSEFVEMFVGVGASRVRDLFRKAKKVAPCIIFIDEIDAVGRQRGAGLGGSHDEREQTLNQILVEMDGFEVGANVIVMAATNRPDVLDPALLRPGRFDRRVIIDEPDIADREAILKVHAKNKPMAEEVSLRKVAERTPGFSGADLANLLNEAAILTARRNKKKIGFEECVESIEKVMLGPERRSRVMSEKEKKITAYHEAGHALVAHELPNTDPVHKISIIARGRAGGYTLKLPIEDKHYHSKTELIENLAVMLAGQVVEKEIFGDITTGASNDLMQATKLARKLVTQYGMSDIIGPRTFGEKEEMIFLGREIREHRDYSEKAAEAIDSEVSKFLKKAYTTAKNIVKEKYSVLEEIVKKLMEKETLEREEFEAIFKTPKLTVI
ncbi:MAG TPA: ATP-dependent zinc metalloprotease FtsH [Patescibacteria group bacterium]|nr:ATP-dependent zinc metalloprotease FtsH [Patescibacteria group bacterium]